MARTPRKLDTDSTTIFRPGRPALDGLPRGRVGRCQVAREIPFGGSLRQPPYPLGMKPGTPVSTTELNRTRALIPSLISRTASPLPMAIGAHPVGEHGAVFATVSREVTPGVAVDVEPPGPVPSLHRFLLHRRVDRRSAPRDLAGTDDVDIQQPCRGHPSASPSPAWAFLNARPRSSTSASGRPQAVFSAQLIGGH